MKKYLQTIICLFFEFALLWLLACSTGPSIGAGTGTADVTTGTINVAVDRTFTVTFSAPVDVNTVTETSLYIAQGTECNADNRVEATIESLSTTEFLITPTVALDYETSYIVCAVSAIDGGIQFEDPTLYGIFEGLVETFVTATEEPVVAATYFVGGTISGLTGTIVLQNNAADDLSITADGSFTFATELDDAATYVVTVLHQPTGQTCTVSNGTGTIATANVTSVSVVCVTNEPEPDPEPETTYTIGGTVDGLVGTVVLQNNSGDNLSRSTNGSFTFSTAILDGANYSVSVLTQPSGYTCTVSSASGTMSGANVTNVSVSCEDIVCTDDCIIFVTSSTTNGNLGGIAGADALCMADNNYPEGSGGDFKALLVDGVNRRACTTESCVTGGASEHVDWVLAASTTYVRLDGTTEIGTTNPLGLLPGALSASFNGEATFSWTGLDSNPLWETDPDLCSSWTSFSDSIAGARGINNSTTLTNAIGIGNSPCDFQRSLVCIEQ